MNELTKSKAQDIAEYLLRETHGIIKENSDILRSHRTALDYCNDSGWSIDIAVHYTDEEFQRREDLPAGANSHYDLMPVMRTVTTWNDAQDSVQTLLDAVGHSRISAEGKDCERKTIEVLTEIFTNYLKGKH